MAKPITVKKMLEDTFAMADKHTMRNVIVEKLELRSRLDSSTDLIVYLFDTKTLRRGVAISIWDQQGSATEFANSLRDAATQIDTFVRQTNKENK